MAFWVVRAGKHGENEDYAVDNSIAVLGWHEIGDISDIADRDALLKLVQRLIRTNRLARKEFGLANFGHSKNGFKKVIG